MKGTRELLTLVLPLMAVGCNGDSGIFSSPPPPPVGLDPEGIYTGIADNGDSFLGIVAADGTADFLEYPANANVPPTATSGAIIVPQAIAPDSNGAFSATFSSYLSNGFTLPNGDTFGTTLSGLVSPASSLSGQYAVTGNDSSIPFQTTYDANDYEVGSSIAAVAGTYDAAYFVGPTPDTAVITITAGTSSTAANVDVVETAFGCHYVGALSIPNPGGNAYEISFGVQSELDCAEPGGLLDYMSGLGALFTVNSSTVMFAIMSDPGVQTGIFVTMTKRTS